MRQLIGIRTRGICEPKLHRGMREGTDLEQICSRYSLRMNKHLAAKDTTSRSGWISELKSILGWRFSNIVN
jgi:hypothetical protein